MIINDIFLIEANVEPEGLASLEATLSQLGKDIKNSNPKINHSAFLKRLRKDIINNDDKYSPTSILEPYEPLDHDVSYIKHATGPVFTIDEHRLADLENELLALFIPDEDADWRTPGEPIDPPIFNQFYTAINDKETPTESRNKLLIIKKKYEQGKFDLAGLKNELKIMGQLGASGWKHNPAERKRLETEAPIIMKFKNGYMWVRLDSQEEMKREGKMMQNCISGYCPVDTGVDLTFGLQDKFRREMEDEMTDDAAYDWLAEWLADNDTDVQDFLMGKAHDLPDEASLAVEEVYDMDEEEAFEWMVNQIIEADTDEATGELLTGHLVYSLRDKNGEAHVSAEYNPDHSDQPTSALGKQNDEADDKYKPYIEKLNNFFKKHPEAFGPAGTTMDQTESVDLNRIKQLAGI